MCEDGYLEKKALTSILRTHKRDWHKSLRACSHLGGTKALLCQVTSNGRIKKKKKRPLDMLAHYWNTIINSPVGMHF